MRHKIRMKLVSIFLLLSIICSIAYLYGCQDYVEWFEEDTYFETEYFRGYIPERGMTLRGLTDLGIEQEELVIPSEVNGIQVKYIGERIGREMYFTKSKAKKVFLPGGISVEPVLLMFGAPKVIFLAFTPEYGQDRWNAFTFIYVPSEARDAYNRMWGGGDSNVVNKANISYINNYDNELNGGYWWIDDLEVGEKIKTIPPIPIREGYTFGGWYKEEECENAWDFETGVKGEEDLILFAKWIIV